MGTKSDVLHEVHVYTVRTCVRVVCLIEMAFTVDALIATGCVSELMSRSGKEVGLIPKSHLFLPSLALDDQGGEPIVLPTPMLTDPRTPSRHVDP